MMHSSIRANRGTQRIMLCPPYGLIDIDDRGTIASATRHKGPGRSQILLT
jgi:hypothetical protein